MNRLAKIALLLIGLIIAISSFQQIWLRNFLAWFVAMALLYWGDKPYPTKEGLRSVLNAIAWGSKRSYCAFLIHFALILLANTLYIATGLHVHESGALAIALILGVVGCSTIAANYLYRWIEAPAMRLKI